MSIPVDSVITPHKDEQGRPIRQIRSFVRRQGRFSAKQEAALKANWATKGIAYHAQLINFAERFNRQAPLVLEIGFGMGHSFVEMAHNEPEVNFLGIEVHLPGVGACLALAEEGQVENIRVMCHDAIEVLENCIANDSLHRVQLFFPDPWHKTKHHKRRIVQPAFVQLLHRKLAPQGVLHMATDWQNYAEHMLEIMNNAVGYRNLSATGDYVPRPSNRPLTKFEKRGQRLGHGIWDLQFQKYCK